MSNNIAPVVQTVQDVDTNGAPIYPDTMPKQYGYDVSGRLETITVTDGTDIWVKTYIYTSGKLTDAPLWVKS